MIGGVKYYKLEPKQELFLIALVSEPTMDKAIERAGITKKTAYRYLKNKDFSAEYSRLRQEMLKRSTKYAITSEREGCRGFV